MAASHFTYHLHEFIIPHDTKQCTTRLSNKYQNFNHDYIECSGFPKCPEKWKAADNKSANVKGLIAHIFSKCHKEHREKGQIVPASPYGLCWITDRMQVCYSVVYQCDCASMVEFRQEHSCALYKNRIMLVDELGTMMSWLDQMPGDTFLPTRVFCERYLSDDYVRNFMSYVQSDENLATIYAHATIGHYDDLNDIRDLVKIYLCIARNRTLSYGGRTVCYLCIRFKGHRYDDDIMFQKLRRKEVNCAVSE